jgi:hypothetical protein
VIQALSYTEIMELTLTELRELATIAIASDLSKDTLDATIARMVILQSMGAHPLASLKDLRICQGSPCLSPALIGATIMRTNRYRYVIASATNNGASVEIHDGEHNLGVETYGREHALRDGSAAHPLHASTPHIHYFGRALAHAARLYLPHLFHGSVMLPDERGMVAHYDPVNGWTYTENALKDAA